MKHGKERAMVTYNPKTEQFTVMVNLGSLVLPVYVRGVEDEIEAKIEAVKAVNASLPSAMDSMDIGGTYPMNPEVTVGLCEIEDVEVL